MSDSKVSITSQSFPVVTLLGAVLVVLKILGYSHISWLWTLSPFWISAVIGIAIFIVVMISAIIVAILDN